MRVIDQEELAILLYETQYDPEDLHIVGIEPKSWREEAEFSRDDFRQWAARILKKARVALKPEGL